MTARRLAASCALFLLAQSRAAVAENEADKPCFPCHFGEAAETAPRLNWVEYQGSVHADTGCVKCHADILDPSIEHEKPDQDLARPDCGSCHEKEQSLYHSSVHGRARERGALGKEAATCTDCHSVHGVRKSSDPKSTTYPLNLGATCGKCHADQALAKRHHIEIGDAYSQYLRGVHAHKVEGPETLIAATCNDCHGTHDIAERANPASTINRTHIVDTCGKCHAEIKGKFRRGVHSSGEKDAEHPVCTTCHSSHGVGPAHDPRFRADLVAECGTCHARQMKTYQETFHGKATLLGDASVAKCSDCHEVHENLPHTDPRSTVHPNHKLETCRRCHPDAPAGFAKFWAHADYHDGKNYPVLHTVYVAMTFLLITVFAFFGLHTLLWWLRGGVDWIRRVRAGKKTQRFISLTEDDRPIRRFQKYHRVTHALVIISFLGLATTGAPLKYPDAGWAQTIFAIIGGVQTAGWLHRLFAVVTFFYFGLHLLFLMRTLWSHRRDGWAKLVIGPESPVPRLQDVKDLVAHMRWFVGLGPKPTWDRWTYWEKFDYWAVFWGVAVIGLSGLVMWFPTFFSEFLPGWAVNIALMIHSDEALLAIGFIFAVHFFNSHLRHEKFPLDPVIFTGVISEEEFKHERTREYERLVAEGRLEERRAPPPSRTLVFWARFAGIAAWITGLVLLVLILYAQLGG